MEDGLACPSDKSLMMSSNTQIVSLKRSTRANCVFQLIPVTDSCWFNVNTVLADDMRKLVGMMLCGRL